MLKHLYCIRDSKTSFLDPFIDVSDESAIRGFRYSCFDAQQHRSLIGFAPEDFSLYRVGDYETLSGELIPCDPKFIANAEVTDNEK